jgi:hypothetical protein
VEALGEKQPDRAVVLENVPGYREIVAHGVGAFLNSPQ